MSSLKFGAQFIRNDLEQAPAHIQAGGGDHVEQAGCDLRT